MLVVLAVTLWLLIALPSVLVLRRYGYVERIEVPLVLIRPGYARLLLDPPINYLLATLLLVFAGWRAGGWMVGIGSCLMASGVYIWAHHASQTRALRALFTDLISTRSHAVQTGETLTSLASRYDVAADELAAANGLALEAPLEPGTELRIPVRPPGEALQLARAIMVRRRRFWPPMVSP